MVAAPVSRPASPASVISWRPYGEELDAFAARERFAGVVRVDLPEDRGFAAAYGLADRRCGVDNTVGTRFAIASGDKPFTALAVMRQVEEGRHARHAGAVGARRRPAADRRAVTVQHLLDHTPGSATTSTRTSTRRSPTTFSRCRSIRWPRRRTTCPPSTASPSCSLPASGSSTATGPTSSWRSSPSGSPALTFHELVETEVCGPAGLSDSAFLRSDELPAGRRDGLSRRRRDRTNVLHLPVRGNGDGGIYSTAADITTLWTALMGAGVVRAETLATMTQPRGKWADEDVHYGLGHLDRRHVRGTHVRGVRRGGLVLHQPRPGPRLDVHGPLEHLGRSLADRDVPAREDRSWRAREESPARLRDGVSGRSGRR